MGIIVRFGVLLMLIDMRLSVKPDASLIVVGVWLKLGNIRVLKAVETVVRRDVFDVGILLKLGAVVVS